MSKTRYFQKTINWVDESAKGNAREINKSYVTTVCVQKTDRIRFIGENIKRKDLKKYKSFQQNDLALFCSELVENGFNEVSKTDAGYE